MSLSLYCACIDYLDACAVSRKWIHSSTPSVRTSHESIPNDILNCANPEKKIYSYECITLSVTTAFLNLRETQMQPPKLNAKTFVIYYNQQMIHERKCNQHLLINPTWPGVCIAVLNPWLNSCVRGNAFDKRWQHAVQSSAIITQSNIRWYSS